jgi:hypothetical protein
VPSFDRTRWAGAFGVCILVILSTFPVVIPFMVFEDARLALRTSNAFAVILLFICAYLFARHAGLWRCTTGAALRRARCFLQFTRKTFPLTITTRPQRRSRFHSHIALFEFGFGPFANHNQYPNSGLPITW